MKKNAKLAALAILVLAAVAALSSMDVPTPYANAATSPWSYWRFFVTSPRTPLA